MRSIHTAIDIAAPVATVWAELSAVEEYAAWNPFVTSFQGELVAGGRANVRIVPPGGRPMTFRPTITKVEAGRRLEWLGRLLLPGLVDGRHSFSLEALEGGGTRLTQAEHFTGCLVPFLGATVERTRAGFEAMNEALRVRSERAAVTDVVR